ncbi:restriction endonuclease subunit S [Alishewanella sp. HL-SH06]|uniref:restriction endonuclease subunit S n=1 Tax=Alishewanella sp. HL-SH06 TaxID=3461144 RepID=UPI004042ECD7
MSFAKYCEFKDSLVHWIGLIPSEWELYKLSHAFGVIGSGTTPKSDEESWYCESDEGIPWVTTGELRENVIFSTFKNVTHDAVKAHSSLKIHPAGSLIIAMYGATIGRLGILAVDATTNQACCVLSVPKTLEPKYAYYWLSVYKDSIISLFSTGGGQPNINQETVSSLRISAPSLIDEQTQIACFLDHEVGKIDALIAEQEKLIALLKEKRQAVISHAVTKGLNPDAPMKDSGVEWLGQVPEHWIVAGFRKYISSIVDYRGKTPEKVESGVFLVTARNIKKGGIDYSLSQEFISEDEYDDVMSRGLPFIGDILFTTEAPLGEVAQVDRTDIALAQRIIKLRANEHYLSNDYFKYFLMSTPFQDSLIMHASGSTALGIKVERLVYLRKLIPPLEEQSQIVAFINKELSKLNLLEEQVSQNILFLNERRSALISAAVTGKIDVRGWQPPAAQ